jgi:hypothetical protein
MQAMNEKTMIEVTRCINKINIINDAIFCIMVASI